MNEFIEKNKRLLNWFYHEAKSLGWILIGITPIYIVAIIFSISTMNDEYPLYLLLYSVRTAFLSYFFLGLTLLCTASFIRYLYDEKTQPGWILLHTEKLLYVYAFFVFLGIIPEFTNPTITINFSLLTLSRLILILLIHRFAQASILIGLGIILRRILPVIEESKTLV